MLVNEIKEKAWKEVSKYNSLDNSNFDNSATTFKINDKYNLAIWCDIDKELDEEERYYIVSVRYNPYDELFGDDIGAEYCTNNITKEELENAIDYVLSHKEITL